MAKVLPIYQVQGRAPHSNYAEQTVTVQGVVTGFVRRGFFIQDPISENPPADSIGCSHALFVHSPKKKPPLGAHLELRGKIVNYQRHEHDKPVTQLKMQSGKLLNEQGHSITPVQLTAELLNPNNFIDDNISSINELLNALEGMLVKIEKGATFIQGSNPFGDYVLSLADNAHNNPQLEAKRANCNGLVYTYNDTENPPHNWLPSFRTLRNVDAPQLNVGAILTSDIQGPLYYRANAFQIGVSQPFTVQDAEIATVATQITEQPDSITVLTLNAFNLDTHIEAPDKVNNPQFDIDDDIGNGQFLKIAEAIAYQANHPDIIALQEIQDNDGAEISDEVNANKTYEMLITFISALEGVEYLWVDLPPQNNRDGGQPGGNIRNGFLYRPDRIVLETQSLQRLYTDHPAYEDSRKPLYAEFALREHPNKPLAIINIHLASKRHRNSIFSTTQPGYDPKLATRVEQATRLSETLQELEEKQVDYYLTGDFNDLEGSPIFTPLLESFKRVNLLNSLPPLERFDYNHRGRLHALMHGIVNQQTAKTARYEVLHGNELLGVKPGELGNKASDHAYVIAQIKR